MYLQVPIIPATSGETIPSPVGRSAAPLRKRPPMLGFASPTGGRGQVAQFRFWIFNRLEYTTQKQRNGSIGIMGSMGQKIAMYHQKLGNINKIANPTPLQPEFKA
jgi:hypothetical protein